MSIILGIIILIFVEVFVLRIVLNLSTHVQSIAKSNNFNARIPRSGYDEISGMTGHINNMLRALDLSQQKIKDHNYKLQQLLQRAGIEEQKSRSIMNSIPDFIVTVSQKEGSILSANTAFQHAFKMTAQELSDNHTTVSFKQLLPSMAHAQEMLAEFEHLSQTQSHLSVDLHTKFDIAIPVLLSTSKSKLYMDQVKDVDVFVVVCRNMSEQKQMAHNFEVQQQEIALLQRQVEFDNMLRTPTLRTAFREYCIKVWLFSVTHLFLGTFGGKCHVFGRCRRVCGIENGTWTCQSRTRDYYQVSQWRFTLPIEHFQCRQGRRGIQFGE